MIPGVLGLKLVHRKSLRSSIRNTKIGLYGSGGGNRSRRERRKEG